ncbi:MAG: OmpA family protein [Lentimicrobiaceae bacterium]|nr:OmpA family protein [Lentimicrobiaceae bacterium]
MKKIIFTIIVISFLPALVLGQSLKRVQKLMNRYQFDEAITLLKRAVADEDKQKEATLLLAQCYKAQNDIYNAKAWYEKAVKLDNVSPETIYEYGISLQKVGEYNKAKLVFEDFLKRKPNDELGLLKLESCNKVLTTWSDLEPIYSVKHVDNLNTVASDFSPIIYDNSIVFASDRYDKIDGSSKYGWTGRGYLKLFKSHPKKMGDFAGELSDAKLFDHKFHQKFHDGPICFSNDNKMVFITRSYRDKAMKVDNYKTNMLKLFYSEKDNDGKWEKFEPFYLNSKEYSVGHAALSINSDTLYFVSDMPNGYGGTDIWMCIKTNDGWGEAINLGEKINTPENEMFPVVGDDGYLYFSSEGLPGWGGLDIFRTGLVDNQWTDPENLLPPLNSSADDFAMAFVPDSKTGFFSSNRIGGKGNDDIYYFVELEKEVKEPEVVPEPEPVIYYLAGVVKDKVTNELLENATVFLYNPFTGKVRVIKTDAKGVYKTIVEPNTKYIAKAMKPTYISDCISIEIGEMLPGSINETPMALRLDKLDLDRIFTIDNIYYDFDKYNIREDAKPQLDKLVKIMLENPVNVELGSHTDSRGTHKYNERLSQNRANSAVEYIISKGINAERITAKGYGETKLVNKCADGVPCTKEEHQMNRRTEFKVTEYTKPQMQIGQFNPDAFHDGEDIDIRSLPSDFYSDCE